MRIDRCWGLSRVVSVGYVEASGCAALPKTMAVSKAQTISDKTKAEAILQKT